MDEWWEGKVFQVGETEWEKLKRETATYMEAREIWLRFEG